jgi:hypothetical protein
MTRRPPVPARRLSASGPAALLLLLLVGAATAAGCGLFDTAQPEPPTNDTQVPPADFTTPESTLVTIERAIENRLTSNYGLALTDSVGNGDPGFYASFDPSDLAAWAKAGNPDPGIWTRDRELTFLSQFLGVSAFYVVTFSPDPARTDFDIDADTRVLNRRYRIFAPGLAPVAGAAGLTFERVGLSGEWKVRFWEDHVDTTRDVQTLGTRRLNGR